jgi:ABC-type glycerol-3-phosphate transport system substrate-binding protein
MFTRPGWRVRCGVAAGLLAVVLVSACEQKPAGDAARVVTVWAHHGQADEHAALQEIVAAFNAAHAAAGLKIEIEFFPDRQYADKVSIAAVSGNLPDVLDIDGPFVGPWAADGILQPLGELVSDELRADFLPTIIAQGTYEDELYALGAFDSALVVYYNREMIAAAGLSPPERIADAWTWDEFVAALEQLKPHTSLPLALHMDDGSDEWFTYAFSPLVWSNGGRLIDTAAGWADGVLDSAANVAAIERWQALFAAGHAQPTATNPDPFSDGLAAFDWTGHWMLPRFEQAAELEFGVMPLPKMGDEFVAPAGSWCWGLSADCDDRVAAWEVISWFVDPEKGIRPIVEANGAVPARQSAFALFPEYAQMPRRLFREQLEQAARARPRTPVYLTLTSEFARALRDIAGGSPVPERLGRAADAVERALQRR